MSVFGFFVFECFNQLSDLFYPSSRGKQKKQAEQLKQGRGENVHVAID